MAAAAAWLADKLIDQIFGPEEFEEFEELEEA